jgi:chitodextrinase/poly(3-hydroxybutyrate) depolymerase
MIRKSPLSLMLVLCFGVAGAQNVFNVNDPIVRYDSTQVLGSPLRPNPSLPGLQKWVSTPTSGVSVGSSAIDVSSFKQYFINFNGTPMAFRLKFPKSFTNPDSATKKYPLMLFLHGAGEVGCPTNGGVYNNEKQLWLGGGLFRDFVDQNLFDAFLLYPQLVNTDGCWGAWGSTVTANFNAVIGMIDSMARYVRVDIDRVIVNGLSGGGYGAWRMADLAPRRIARIIPSAAASTAVNRANVVHIPIWFATGAKDPDPNTVQADNTLKRLKDVGADIRYTRYEDLGHAVWYRHWREPDYAAVMNDAHKANPLVYFQHNAFCENETIAARLGISAGFNAYEWQRNGVTIATWTNGVSSIIAPQYVTSFSGNEIVIKSFGIYRVRFRRTATSEWSVFSPKPVEVKLKSITITPPITVQGAHSSVLPALDGSSFVPLQLPAGFLSYEWYRVSDNTHVATTRIYEAPVGVYKARVTEQFGCGTEFSSEFKVVEAGGSPKPEPAAKLIATPFTQKTINLSWTQGTGETGFEIYRSATSNGPYKFVTTVNADATTYSDTGLAPNSSHYYILRAINATGASEKSNEATAKTLADNSFPSAPNNLQYRGSTLTSVQLSWNAATDNGGIKRYDIYVNGVKLYSTTGTRFNVTRLDSLKSYTFVVKAVDNSENASAPSNQVTAFTHRQGLNYRYYTTTANWYTIPDLKALTPVKTGSTDSINVNDKTINPVTERFGFLWEGFIYIPATSTYTFETRSDDGSKLYIDVPYRYTAKPLVNNDTIHGMRSRTGTITLTQGYHTIAVAYFQRTNGWGMELFWKNTSGLAREMIPKNFFSQSNGPAPVTLNIPSDISATALSHNQIGIKWTDNNENENGYEVLRSTSSTGTFVPVGTTSANATGFIDSGLVHLKAYYYKLRSIAPGSESPYSSVVSATTLAASKLVAAPAPLTAFAGAGNSIVLTWQDNAINEWNYRVYRSTNGTSFTPIFASKPNVNAYTDLTPVSQTNYYYYVVGYNAAGLGPKTNVVRIKAGNSAPVFSQVQDLHARTGENSAIEFTVSDETGDKVEVSIPNRPAFLSVTAVSSNSFRISANPTNDNIGQYTITIQAKDNNGAGAETYIVVTVTDSKTRSVFVNFGDLGKTAKSPWNNWLGKRSAGDVINNLRDENNVPTPISLTTVNGWSGTTVLGHMTGNNSGVAPDSVLESGIIDNGTARQLLIAGLDPEKRYNLSFIGSQNEGLLASAQYSTGNETAQLDARFNTMRSANLNGILPNATGEIVVNISRIASSPFTYLNGLIIEELRDPGILLNPVNLYGEQTGRNKVDLTWNDRAATESIQDGYELQRAADSLFSQNVLQISLPSNSNSYTDDNLLPDTKYWYRVRAKSGSQASEYSNRFALVTPSSIVYVNFNSTLPDEGFPWNNTAASPLSEFVIDNLNNESGVASGLRLMVTKVFNGEFTAGAQTGNNSGVVPDRVLASNFWIDNTQLSQVKLSGFNHTKRYRIGFVGSSSTPGWFKGNYTATYSVNGRTVYLNSWMNTTKAVYISDIVPDVSGDIYLDFSTTRIGQWAFNAGIIVQEYTDTGTHREQYMSNSILDTAGRQMETQIARRQVRIHPNPFRDQLNIEFYNEPADDRLVAEMYDVAGRLVHRQQFVGLTAGVNTLRIVSVNAAARGVFMLSLKVNGKVIHSQKMLRDRR